MERSDFLDLAFDTMAGVVAVPGFYDSDVSM